MVTFRRLMLWFSLFTGVLAFLVLAGNLSAKEQMIFGATILLLIIFLMGTGGGRKVERIRRRSDMEAEESKSEPDQELPAPVQSEEDASARRDAKLSRSRSGEPEPEPETEVEEVVVSLADDEVSVTVIDENVHVAEEFVAEIDAESMEEADIESYIDDRRGRHALIRRRIEARRREQLADIRSETAKIYQSADESEDILTLVGTENHGHTILEVSEDIPAGSPVGAVFARIDDTRILKVRLPLDQGFIASSEPLPELPPLPDLGDLPLPPLPDIGDLPLPPPPSSSKLDALRDEMDE
ncbi:MAG TPA: hypothetical protein QF716_05195 [Candidatus Thalassarchaeaceae archaeon]|jgi:hypothetical protein|nr:hypothetical protein [Candidatus Thalassarchaeaceae archaeon]HJM68252.1 hypothetical protein [Candidatus Thalassarchaeaceae archaeon]